MAVQRKTPLEVIKPVEAGLLRDSVRSNFTIPEAGRMISPSTDGAQPRGRPN